MVKIKKLNLMYTKLVFLSQALIEVNDELEGTPVFRHKLKYWCKNLTKELENTCKKDINNIYQDEDAAINVFRAISDIASMIAQMTLNDWLHVRNSINDYLKTPDSVRLLNRAVVKPLDNYKASDLEEPKPNYSQVYYNLPDFKGLPLYNINGAKLAEIVELTYLDGVEHLLVSDVNEKATSLKPLLVNIPNLLPLIRTDWDRLHLIEGKAVILLDYKYLKNI